MEEEWPIEVNARPAWGGRPHQPATDYGQNFSSHSGTFRHPPPYQEQYHLDRTWGQYSHLQVADQYMHFNPAASVHCPSHPHWLGQTPVQQTAFETVSCDGLGEDKSAQVDRLAKFDPAYAINNFSNLKGRNVLVTATSTR